MNQLGKMGVISRRALLTIISAAGPDANAGLPRKEFPSTKSLHYVMPAIFVGSVLLVLIGGFGVTRAEPGADGGILAQARSERAGVLDAKAETSGAGDAPRPADQAETASIRLRAVAAQTGRTIEGVSVSYIGSFGGKELKGTVTTDPDGAVTIDYPSSSKVLMLELTATRTGYVPIFIRWDRFGKPVKIPPFKELRFEGGTEIGGVVKDEAGKPIAGATIYRYSPPTECEGARVVFMSKGPTTDEQGHWRMSDAPSNLAEVRLEAVHPSFQTGNAPATTNLDSVMFLKKGFAVRGRVVQLRRPARPGCQARDGSQLLGWPVAGNLDQGERRVCLRAVCRGLDHGHGPGRWVRAELREVRVGERLEPLTLRLQPASELRLRVVDLQGKPVSGAFVYAQTCAGITRSTGARRRTRRVGSHGPTRRETACSMTSASRVSWPVARMP